MATVESQELAAAILEPHFDAVRDTFAEYEPEPGLRLDRLRKTKMVISPLVHDTARHYAMCRDDGMLIKVAPEAIELPWENLVAIMLHEFGHAADHVYPGRWVPHVHKDGSALWVSDGDTKEARAWRRLWEERSQDQVETAADAIALAVTGVEVRYCGPCMIQCFEGGRARPGGLR